MRQCKKNMVEPEGPQKMWWMSVACLISKATRGNAYAHARAPTPARTTHTLAFFFLPQWQDIQLLILRFWRP